MFEKYNEHARRAILYARYEATELESPQIETEHLLLGILRQEKALPAQLCKSFSDLDATRKEIERITTRKEKISVSLDMPLSEECKRALAYAAEESEQLAHNYIGPGHLLLGLLRQENSLAARLMHDRGLRLAQVRKQIAGSA